MWTRSLKRLAYFPMTGDAASLKSMSSGISSRSGSGSTTGKSLSLPYRRQYGNRDGVSPTQLHQKKCRAWAGC